MTKSNKKTADHAARSRELLTDLDDAQSKIAGKYTDPATANSLNQVFANQIALAQVHATLAVADAINAARFAGDAS